MIFDLDGTLIDSEDRTNRVVRALLDAKDLDPGGAVDLTRFHGATWEHIGTRIGSAFPTLAGRALAAELQAAFHASLLADPPPLIRGARTALIEALHGFPTAVVTSSNRESLEQVLMRFEVDCSGLVTVCAEDVLHSKPAPDGYLMAAEQLEVSPNRCLVFEDSNAGLSAAGTAGMTTIAIARDRGGDERSALGALASLVICDFTELPSDFFTKIATESSP